MLVVRALACLCQWGNSGSSPSFLISAGTWGKMGLLSGPKFWDDTLQVTQFPALRKGQTATTGIIQLPRGLLTWQTFVSNLFPANLASSLLLGRLPVRVTVANGPEFQCLHSIDFHLFWSLQSFLSARESFWPREILLRVGFFLSCSALKNTSK